MGKYTSDSLAPAPYQEGPQDDNEGGDVEAVEDDE